MNSYKIWAIVIICLSVLASIFVFTSREDATYPFKLGLDLVGGTHLVYEADISELESSEVSESMRALRSVLERRLNPFGTSEVSVIIEQTSVFSENSDQTQRVIIELPGVTDPDEAKALIGEIPLLEFELQNPEIDFYAVLDEQRKIALVEAGFASSTDVNIDYELANQDLYIQTGLTGRYIQKATYGASSVSGEPLVNLRFTPEGRDLFGQITRENVGQVLAIFLDGEVISQPVIQSQIFDGNAQISGSFTVEEAQELARNLNFGALPVPIESVSTQSISPSLGQNVLVASVTAAVVGIALVMLFMITVYRLAGFIASFALFAYVVFLLSLFKLFGFVFTAAGIAGFIISIGMAVDANILIFERIKEELSYGKKTIDAIKDGFSRAWLSIRDSNISSIITAIILFYLTSSLVQGFALAFGFGVLVSMLTAILVTRAFLLAIATDGKKFRKVLLGKVKRK